MSVCLTDGTRVASSTGIDLLLLDDFKLIINDITYHVRPPKRGKSAWFLDSKNNLMCMFENVEYF